MTYINLVLIGFMGSGKSSVAKSLYQKTKKLILDSDKIIANNEIMRAWWDTGNITTIGLSTSP